MNINADSEATRPPNPWILAAYLFAIVLGVFFVLGGTSCSLLADREARAAEEEFHIVSKEDYSQTGIKCAAAHKAAAAWLEAKNTEKYHFWIGISKAYCF